MLSKTTSDKVVHYKSNPTKDNFARELRTRVNHYFKSKNISPQANRGTVLKAILGFVIWGLFFRFVLSDFVNENIWWLIFAFMGLGFSNIFLAFNIMHDACHNAFSKNNRVNYWLGYTMNFVGGNSYLFTKMHNAHHAFVNIAGIDVTLETHGMFRFTPHEPWRPKHRWQHLYTPILYSFAMIHWVLIKDFKWIFAESNIGNEKQLRHPKREYAILFITKLLYYSITLGIPFLVLTTPWWWILVAWVNMHILPSLCFALLFQVTHIYTGTHYPIPDNEGNIENNYFIHVLETTADFSRENKFITWLVGGINIHVAHHLFPHICHAHYIPVTRIIKQAAADFGLQYKENKNFWTALRLHFEMLYHLSKKDAVVPQYGSSATMMP